MIMGCLVQPLLSVALPDLARELEQLLAKAGKRKLAAQVPQLKIVDRCHCENDFCSTFYVQPKPQYIWGPRHDNLELSPHKGMFVLDVVEGKIAAIEVLYRDDVHEKLLELIP
jgi:hypothetical protein